MAQRTTVALLFGGVSAEHGVSCLTAASVLKAIDPARYRVVCVGISPLGRWTLMTPEQVLALTVHDQHLPQVPEDGDEAVLLHAEQGVLVAALTGTQLSEPVRVDVAFALLHGPFGEDGTIQGLFEMYAVPYVGSGVAASALGMDKSLMKQTMAAGGLPIGAYRTIEPHAWVENQARCLADLAPLGFPVYVKPARGGSSIGISRVEDADGLVAAIELARRYDPKVIVEAGFVGVREIECAVLEARDHGRPRTSVLGEIRMHTPDAFYDFDAKYLPENQVSLDAPALVEPELAQRIQDLAAETFRVMGSEGLARVDTFVTTEGEVVINEINTMPGFTSLSMYPTLWAASGLSYPELVDELIQLALLRPPGLR